jgi:hypothetical protein
MLNRSALDEHVVWIAELILTQRRTKIARRDIQRSYTALKSVEKRGQINSAMDALEFHDWVKLDYIKMIGRRIA